MSDNKKGPFEVQIPYVASDGFPHVFRANAIVPGTSPDPGTPSDDVTLVTRMGSIDLQTGVNELWDALRTRLPLLTLASTFSFWKIPTAGGDPIFISAGDLDTPNGASGVMVESWMETRTFRTGNGGIAKIVLMDTRENTKVRIPIPSADEIKVWALGDTSWMVGRDDGFIVAPMNLAYGESEALFKARHRR